MKKHRLWTGLCGVTLLLTATATARQPGGGGGPPPAAVRLAEATMDVVEKKRNATGDVFSLKRSLLASREDGLVMELVVREGDSVEQGQLIAQLDDALLRLERETASADVATAEAVLSQREAELDRDTRDVSRVERLAAENSASETQIDQVQTRERQSRALLAQAKADLASKRAELAVIAKRIEDMKITAPFSGRVATKSAEIGEWLSRGDPVIELVSLEEIEVRVDIPEAFLGRIGGAGQQIEVIFPALSGGMRMGTVVAVIPTADPLSRTFPVRLSVDNADGLLRPGMSATASIPTSERGPALTIPKDAVLRDDAGEYVYFNGGGSAVPARITTLFATGSRVAIRSGGSIFPGAMVVVEGNERLFPTQPLNILNPAEKTDAKTNTTDAETADMDRAAEGG